MRADKPLVKIVKSALRARVPVYSTEEAAGADLSALLDAELILAPGERKLIPTGLKMELPPGFEGQVRPRSGLAIKAGVTVLNAPGTIDADYRGEIQVIMINLSDNPFVIRDGDRIAQLVICPVCRADFETRENISESVRSSGGFGSTGV